MNERWKELAEQATNDCMGVDVLDKQRFAELIVRECAHVGFNAAYPGKAVDVKIAIKEHFGVEE